MFNLISLTISQIIRTTKRMSRIPAPTPTKFFTKTLTTKKSIIELGEEKIPEKVFTPKAGKKYIDNDVIPIRRVSIAASSTKKQAATTARRTTPNTTIPTPTASRRTSSAREPISHRTSTISSGIGGSKINTASPDQILRGNKVDRRKTMPATSVTEKVGIKKRNSTRTEPDEKPRFRF